MSTRQAREVTVAKRLDNVRYAIRDLACVADEVIQQGATIKALKVNRDQQHARARPHLVQHQTVAVYRIQ
jgi:hypothetical protein